MNSLEIAVGWVNFPCISFEVRHQLCVFPNARQSCDVSKVFDNLVTLAHFIAFPRRGGTKVITNLGCKSLTLSSPPSLPLFSLQIFHYTVLFTLQYHCLPFVYHIVSFSLILSGWCVPLFLLPSKHLSFIYLSLSPISLHLSL